MAQMRGLVSHDVEWEEAVPVAIRLELKGGVRLRLDLAGRTLVQEAGEPLRPKQLDWCIEIGEYLVRQALLERQEELRKQRGDGRAAIDFEPRPDPKVIWWG
ncbi:MAG: hypothetical protein HQL56_04675 [Magnetococcales bacterium]|nr:hypothetical protein [Magnetococcales bacterium]